MRILTRYILREVTAHALIGVAVFTFVLFTRDLGQILELVVRNSAPLPSVAEVFFFIVPVTLTISIPAGVLVGILIGLSRLAADSEITAMRASGIGVWSFLRIVSIFAVAAWLLALANGVYLAPQSQAAMVHLQDRLKSSQVSFEVQPRVFYEGFPGLVLYVQNVKAAQGAAIWKGVFIADTSTPSSPRITLARQGILVSEGPETLHLHLTDGSTHEIDPKSSDHYQISTFEQTDIPIPVPQADNTKEQEPVPVSQMGTWELWRQASIRKTRPGPLVPDRVPSPLRLAHVVPGIGAGRNSPRPVVKKRRQVHRIRAHHSAGVRLLFRVTGWSFAGAAGKVIARLRGVAGGHRFLPGRRFSAVARRTQAV